MIKFYLGTDRETRARIYLTAPAWDCGWYWGFGYLGNDRCHFHLEAYQSKDVFYDLKDGSFKYVTIKRNMNMVDCLKEDYELNPVLLKNIWAFCELVQSAYTLKKAAEVLGRGGSHMTINVCAETIKNADEVTRINDVVLPAIFAEIAKLFKE